MAGGKNFAIRDHMNSCQELQFTESPVALELRM